MDSNNIRIRKITAGGIITTVAGTGEQVESTKGPATRSGLLDVGGLAVTADGTLYIADPTGLQKVDPSGMLSLVITGQSVGGVALGRSAVYYSGVGDVWLLGPNGTGRLVGGADPGDANDGGPAIKAAFFVSHAAVDPQGNIYVADKEAHRIRRFAPGGVISTVAGNGTPGFEGDGGPAAHSQLNRPESIAIDVAGNVYIADTANFRVRRVGTDGLITSCNLAATSKVRIAISRCRKRWARRRSRERDAGDAFKHRSDAHYGRCAGGNHGRFSEGGGIGGQYA